MQRKSCWWTIALSVLITATSWGGTFGKVVSIGGAASDLALDEPRGVLYIANFTANRIEVMSLTSNTIQTSINVAAQPASLALSPDGHYLVVAHYGNFAPPATSANGLTVIDLTTKAKQTFVLGNPPLGVAFGIDGLALVVTTQEFLAFDPTTGTTAVLDTIAAQAAKALPQPAASFPPNIVAASLGVSGDKRVIYGFGDSLLFRYDLNNHSLRSTVYSASPPLGPRVISVSQDGSYFTAGWTLKDSTFFNISQFSPVGGLLNVGSTQIDSSRGLIYAQIPPTSTVPPPGPPILQIVDADNLAPRDQLLLPENLAGKSTLTSDHNTMYSVSDSGVLVLPVGSLNKAPRVAATQEDVVFRGNFCNRNVTTQFLTIVDPGGGSTPFSLSSSTPGLTVSPATGVTPATVRVSVDPSAFQNQKGTVTASISITSSAAVNKPVPVRVLINNMEPEQRGTFVNVPGKLVDLLADPKRTRYYILRQDKNQVLVFDGTNNTQIATLRTGNTPMSMAITFDQRYLLVGCDNAQYVNVYDLDLLQAQRPIQMSGGDYVQSIATSQKAILAVTRNAAGGDPNIHRLDIIAGTSFRLPSLGVFDNKVALNSVLASSTNGATILVASSDGTLMLYDANVDTFTVSRKDFTALSGAYAASGFNQYVVGNSLLNSSLVPVAQFESSTGKASGFTFVDQGALRTTAPDASSPGVIERVDQTGATSRATRMVEAPVLGTANAAFTRTLAVLADRSAFINLTVSGFTVLPPTYDNAVAPPVITSVVNAADGSSKMAPGGLISILGQQLSPVNLATTQMPLPTALGDSCLTVNGLPIPIIFVSPTQINAQMPFQSAGNITLILRTPGGTSDNFNLVLLPGAPSIFRSGTAGPETNLPTLVRADDNLLITDAHPIHRGDSVVIYLTGLGLTSPLVDAGVPSPSDPLPIALLQPQVDIGGVLLPILYAGLSPGEIGVYQINVSVPKNVPLGLGIPLTITQAGVTTSVPVRVVN